MNSILLGKSSLRTSRLAYGCWRLAGSEGSGRLPVDVGVRMTNHPHTYVLGDLPALEVGNHGMPETMKAFTRHLVLPALGVARVYPSLSHDANKGLAKAAAASGKSLAHRG